MKSERLGPVQFADCPVWTWDESMEAHVPVKNHDPLPRGTQGLFVKAVFRSPGGHQFCGYLIGAERPHGCALFFDADKVTINLQLRFSIENAKQAIDKWCGKGSELFPLEYWAEFHFEGEPNLAGTLVPSSRPLFD